jgi:hypothetical protein
MFTLSVSLDSLSLYIVAADIIILLSYVMYLIHNKRRLQRNVQRITDFITDYFLNTGAEVKVSCYKLEDMHRYVVMIESEPLKRFRFSNVLESNIIGHVFKVTGSIVDKIYWRFPVQINKQSVAQDEEQVSATPTEAEDLYFEDAQAHLNAHAEYNVSEVTWDEFEHAKKQS